MSQALHHFLNALPVDEEITTHIASQVILFSEIHEKKDHGGEPCLDERINLMAFLCHSLGIKVHHIDQLAQRLEGYETRHDANIRQSL